jgi:hypothetical protein
MCNDDRSLADFASSATALIRADDLRIAEGGRQIVLKATAKSSLARTT